MSINEDYIEQAKKGVLNDEGGDPGSEDSPDGISTTLKCGLYLVVTNLVSSVAISYIVTGGPDLAPEVYIAETLNFFIVPVVLLTDVFKFPLWVWYILFISWIGTLTIASKLDSTE